MDNNGAYLFGTGGSGMTFLKRKFGWINKAPESTQHFRYLNKKFMGVKIDIPDDVKIVYLFAHPFDVLLSFERRGFLAKYDMSVANLQGDMQNYKKIKIKNLNDYVSKQKDLFMFGHHFNSFYSLPNKVLFIKYEVLEQNIKFIARWAGVSIDTNEELKERASNFSKCDCKMLRGMIDIHGGWADHYNNLPDYFTNKGINYQFKNKTKFDYLYN